MIILGIRTKEVTNLYGQCDERYCETNKFDLMFGRAQENASWALHIVCGFLANGAQRTGSGDLLRLVVNEL